MAFTHPEYHPSSNMFLEPPSKRLRLMGAGPMAGFANAHAVDYDDNDDEFDELLYEPDEVAERRDPDCKLMRRRIAASNRFQSAMADIIERFDRDFGDEGDEISFATGEVVVDRGHLTSLQIWDRSDGEEDVDGEEDEGIRLEDLPDDWGEEDACAGRVESAPERAARQGRDGEAQGEVTEDMAVDVTPHSNEGVPLECVQQQAQFTTGQFTVVLPRKSPPPGFTWPQAHNELLNNVWSCQPEEYDSGFGSSTNECRRSGRVRKQVDFLGKITWAEALGLDTASPWAATPHTTPPHPDASLAIDGHDEGHYVPTNLGDTVSEDMGISNPTLRPSSPSPMVIVPDSQETAVSPSSSVTLDNSLSPRDSHLEVADSDAESDTESDVQPDPEQRSASAVSSGSQYHDAREDTMLGSGSVIDTAQADKTMQRGDEPFESATENQELSHGILEKAPQDKPTEIPDSQGPSSSAVRDPAITQMIQQREISTEPDEAAHDTESCIAVDAPDLPQHWAEIEPSPTKHTPSKSNKSEPLQQITPRPSPTKTKTKPATPSKHRSSPAHPHTPRHCTVNLAKPPSSRRSILSLVSDDHRDAGRRSDDDDESELLREDELAVTIPQLFASSRSNKRRRKLKAEIYRTPVKQRTDRLLTPLSSGKTCGQGGVKCGSDFCFTCM